VEDKIEVLKTAAEYLVKLKQGVKSIAEFYESGDYNSGSKVVLDAVDGFQWIIQVVALTKDELKQEIDENELKDKFSEVVEAMENEDYILTGDLFQYEVLPILEKYEVAINESILN